MKRLLLCVGLAMLVVMATGCPDHHGSDTEMKLVKDIPAMITAFVTGDYEAAKEKAEEIIALDPDYSEPYAILGFIYMAQDSLDQAKTQFDIAVEKPEGDTAHAYAGRAILNRELDYEAAIRDGETLLAAAPDYELSSSDGDIVLTATDIKLLIAQCHYVLGQFEKAQESADIEVLDPSDVATWVVNGTEYKSYEAALGVALQALDESITVG